MTEWEKIEGKCPYCNKETSSIVNTERIGDIPDNNFTGWGRQGWICPKCGRVMSPDTPFCLFCSNEVKTTVTTNTGGAGGCSPNDTTTVQRPYLRQQRNN